MSLIGENTDSIDGGTDAPALGPRVGFMDAFENSYNQSTKAAAQYGIAHAMNDQQQQQIEALRGAGEENIPEIAGDNFSGDFEKVANFYENGGDPDQAARLQAYDDHVNELKTKYPKLNLQTSKELWDGVKAQAISAEQNEQQQRTTPLGAVGDFLGGAIGSVNPRANPLGFISAPLAGAGESVVARVAGQGALQGASSAVEQATGVQSDRALLGLSHGIGDAAARVGGAVLGGAAGQGIGEILHAGAKVAGKRWFGDNGPADMAPPPPPEPGSPDFVPPDATAGLPPEHAQKVQDFIDGKINYDDLLAAQPFGDNRMGAARSMLDADHVTQQLQDWDGDYPGMVTPRTVLDIPDVASDGVRFAAADDQTRAALGRVTVDEAARRVDPKTFSIYDDLADQKNQLRQTIEQLRPDSTTATSDFTDRIAEIDDQLNQTGREAVPGRKAKQLTVERDQLVQDRQATMDHLQSTDTPEMAAARQKLLDLDSKMRDMAPTISRAYARVRGEWQLPPDYNGAVRRMVADGAPTLPDVQPDFGKPVAPQLVPETLTDKAPILENAPRVENEVGKHADGADIANKIIKDNLEAMTKSLDSYRDSIGKLLSEESDGKVRINGTDLVLDLDKDKIAIPQDDGDGNKVVTIRELLEDQARSEEDQKAVTSCST